jgi:hypothetical protein
LRNIAQVYEELPVIGQKKELFADARDKLNAFLDSASPFTVNQKTATNRQILYLFVYGNLAHANPAKKQAFDRLVPVPIFGQLLWNHFVFILTDVVSCVLYIHGLNAEVIKETMAKS